MAKRAPVSESSGTARWLWSAHGARLFDPAGIEYEPSGSGLERAEVGRLVHNGQTPVAIHDCGAGVKWHPTAQSASAWASVESDFEDVQDWHAPAGAPGTLPYRAELWRETHGTRTALVLRND